MSPRVCSAVPPFDTPVSACSAMIPLAPCLQAAHAINVHLVHLDMINFGIYDRLYASVSGPCAECITHKHVSSVAGIEAAEHESLVCLQARSKARWLSRWCRPLYVQPIFADCRWK